MQGFVHKTIQDYRADNDFRNSKNTYGALHHNALSGTFLIKLSYSGSNVSQDMETW